MSSAFLHFSEVSKGVGFVSVKQNVTTYHTWSAPSFLFSSLVAQTIKCLPITRETWVQYLGQGDPLEKAMAPHSSTLARKIPWTEEPGRLQSMGSQRVGQDWVTSLSFFLLKQHLKIISWCKLGKCHTFLLWASPALLCLSLGQHFPWKKNLIMMI